MDKKDNNLKKIENEIRIIQRELDGIVKKCNTDAKEGVLVFRPTCGTSREEIKRLLQKTMLYDWNILTINGDTTPTIITLFENLEKLKDLANKDPLTGLLNRKQLNNIIMVETERCYRTRQPLCILFIDLDDFKKINDTMGHDVGDRVLIEVANKLKEQCRKTDHIGRYGGEEFVIVLPSTSLVQGEITAERIRSSIRNIRFEEQKNGSFRVTCSIGLCCYKGRKKINPEFILKQADNALYEAKNRGKDRIVSAGIVDIDAESIQEMVKVNPEEKNFLFGKTK
ncbi:hypothetical protein JCM13304A_11850 [Desulfothermus okinawensis JCM 13304]